ncbi:unnamed protein product [Discula destructiva]
MPSPSRSKPSSPPFSAWTRLVQVTKRASQASRLDDGAKPPPLRIPDTAIVTTTTDDAAPPRPASKRRRLTGQATMSALARSRLAARNGDDLPEGPSAEDILRREAGLWLRHGAVDPSVVCTWAMGTSGGKTSFASAWKNKEISLSSPSSSPGSNELRKLWRLPSTDGKDKQFRHEEPAREDHKLDGEGTEEDDAGMVSDGYASTLDSLGEDESVQDLPARDVLDDAKPRQAHQDITDSNDKAVSVKNGTSPTRAAQAIANDSTLHRHTSSSLRGGFRMRRRAKVEEELDELHSDHDTDAHQTTAQHQQDKALDTEGADPRVTARLSPTSPSSLSGLHEGSQDSLNRSPKSATRHSQPEVTQLATPSSSQSSTTADEIAAVQPATRRTKRRLTLHDSQPAPKKRKRTPPKKTTVQTTLALAVGDSAGMRECKVCDTVYNPFHPEDVRVHKLRHAGAMKRERAALTE